MKRTLETCERERMAIELHDGLAQTLTAAALQVREGEMDARARVPVSSATWTELGDLLESAARELRRFIHALSVPAFGPDEWRGWLAECVERAREETGMAIDLSAPFPDRGPVDAPEALGDVGRLFLDTLFLGARCLVCHRARIDVEPGCGWFAEYEVERIRRVDLHACVLESMGLRARRLGGRVDYCPPENGRARLHVTWDRRAS